MQNLSLPEEVINPAEATEVSIAEGASLPTNGQFFVPEDARGTIGISNKVVWTNTDITGHTVTTDDGYTDLISGVFDSAERLRLGAILMPGETFEFTFTQVGEYPYRCDPHPHMQAVVEIVEELA